jgi:hypothetical protein
MPIEIRELIIKAEVGERKEQGSRTPSGIDRGTKQHIIQECVEMVLEILKKEKER